MGVGAGGFACDSGAGIDICFGTGTLMNISGQEIILLVGYSKSRASN